MRITHPLGFKTLRIATLITTILALIVRLVILTQTTITIVVIIMLIMIVTIKMTTAIGIRVASLKLIAIRYNKRGVKARCSFQLLSGAEKEVS